MRKIFLSVTLGLFLIFNLQAQNVIKVDRSNERQTIQLNQDQVLEISLARKASTGYGWYESNSITNKSITKVITQLGDYDFVLDPNTGTSTDGNSFVGQSGTQITRFVGVSKGTTLLRLELRRPWEMNEPASDIYTITVVSTGKYTGTFTPAQKLKAPNYLTSTPLDLPSKLDWRSQCTPVKNQAQCGSCWAFAGVGTLECNIRIHDGVTRDLSEQFLMNCGTDVGNGCQGGQCPHKHWMAPGCVYESEVPYVSSGCNLTDASATCVGVCGTYTYHEAIDSYGSVSGGGGNTPADSSVKRAIYNYGPVWITVDASSSAWQNYGGGVLTETSPAGYTDHAVVLVGWVDSTEISGGGFWILRNSWGSNWGVSGYMYISYGSDLVCQSVDYVVYKGGTPHITPPITNFISSATTSCTGTIQFTDASANTPTSWIWNFGDGTTSTLRNPSHTYTTNGIYNVSLIATNSFGNNTVTKTNYITINLPSSPITTGATTNVGGSDTLHASGTGILKWYDAATGGNLVNTGTSYILNPISTAKTFYVDNNVGDVQTTQASVGIAAASTSASTGSYYTTASRQGLLFNVLVPIKIKTVTVKANSTANRTIFLQNSSGVVIDSLVVNIATGTQTVTLNFNVPVGNGYTLGCNSSSNLWRETSGVVYPYSISGVVSITGSTAGTTNIRYYYFYNWQVEYTNSSTSCISARVPVTASVYSPIPAIISPSTSNVCSGIAQNYTITSTNSSTTFNWVRTAVAGISNTAVTNQTNATIFETLINTTNSPINVTYQITPSANGYTGSTFTYTVTVNPIPSVTSLTSDSVCSGVAQNYIISSTLPESIYSWTRTAVVGINNLDASNMGNPIAEVLSNTTPGPVNTQYKITPIANGCSGNVFTYTVTVNPIPLILNSTSGAICSGVAQNNLLISQVSGTTFNWSRTSVLGLSDTTKINQTSNPITETLYNITSLRVYTVYLITPTANGCSGNQFSYLLSVYKLPITAGNISGQDTVCPNNSYSYTVPVISNSNYIWNLPDGTIDTVSSNSIAVNYTTSSTNGNITVKGSNICGNGGSSTMAIYVGQTPQKPIISDQGGVLVSSSSVGNQWYNGDTLKIGATNQTYAYTTINGNYYDIVSTNGCSSATSDTIHITAAGINVFNTNLSFEVYPNPITNELIIKSNGTHDKIVLEIFNSIGQVIYKGNVFEKTVVNTTNFAKGIYLLKLDNDENVDYKKIIKE